MEEILRGTSLAPHHKDDNQPKTEIEEFILQQIPLKAEAAHTEEVAWLLFWAREIGLKVPVGAFDKVRMLRSSVVGLLSLDLRQGGLVDGNLKVPEWKSFATADGLKSEMWMIAYEATKKGWWPGSNKSNFISEHPYFSDMLTKDVEFYDLKKKAKGADASFALPFVPNILSGGGSGGYPA